MNQEVSLPQSSAPPPPPADIQDARVWTAIHAAQEKKALNLVVLDIGPLTSFADYFVLASGTSSRHVQAVVDEIEKKLREAGTRPRHIEGYGSGEWALLDYGDFIVHVFTPDARTFYDLERLWADAHRLVVPPDGAPSPATTQL
jgi:ribosome-associated protein